VENYSKSNKKRVRFFPVILLFFILMIALLLIDSSFRIVTTEYELYYNNFPESFDGFRIVLLADIHDTEFGKDSSRLISLVRDANPDIIALAGDLMNAADNGRSMELQLKTIETLVTGLTQIAPVYFVNGNHDIVFKNNESGDLLLLLETQGVRVINHKYVRLESGSDIIVLGGVDLTYGSAGKKKTRAFLDDMISSENDAFTIVIEHRNNNLALYSEYGIDLVLSGHAHGGIIRLPFTDGLLGQKREWFPEHTDGVYTMGNTNMLVSRGLSNRTAVPRFLNNPHIAVAILRSA